MQETKGNSDFVSAKICGVWYSLIAVVLIIVVGSGAYASQDNSAKPVSKTFQDWTFVDPSKAGVSCFIVQQVFSKKSGVKLMEASLYPIKAGKGKNPLVATIAMSVPTGADLVSGIAYRHVRGKRTAIGLEWQSCNSSRCTASGKISRKELKRLRRERTVIVGFRPLPNSRLLNVPLSLSGLSRAWRQVGRCGMEKK